MSLYLKQKQFWNQVRFSESQLVSIVFSSGSVLTSACDSGVQKYQKSHKHSQGWRGILGSSLHQPLRLRAAFHRSSRELGARSVQTHASLFLLWETSCFWAKGIAYSKKARLLTLCPRILPGGGMGTAVCCALEAARLGQSPNCCRHELGWPRGQGASCPTFWDLYPGLLKLRPSSQDLAQDTNYPTLRIYLI